MPCVHIPRDGLLRGGINSGASRRREGAGGDGDDEALPRLCELYNQQAHDLTFITESQEELRGPRIYELLRRKGLI